MIAKDTIDADELVALYRTFRAEYYTEMRERQGFAAAWQPHEVPKPHVYATLAGLTAVLREMGVPVDDLTETDDPASMIRAGKDVSRETISLDGASPLRDLWPGSQAGTNIENQNVESGKDIASRPKSWLRWFRP